jgi:hypothetical protein
MLNALRNSLASIVSAHGSLFPLEIGLNLRTVIAALYDFNM